MGEKRGINGSFGPLYTYGAKALEIFEPLWFVAENVGGLRNVNDGSAFNQILSDLEETGYNIKTHLYKFERYGIPQSSTLTR